MPASGASPPEGAVNPIDALKLPELFVLLISRVTCLFVVSVILEITEKDVFLLSVITPASENFA